MKPNRASVPFCAVLRDTEGAAAGVDPLDDTRLWRPCVPRLVREERSTDPDGDTGEPPTRPEASQATDATKKPDARPCAFVDRGESPALDYPSTRATHHQRRHGFRVGAFPNMRDRAGAPQASFGTLAQMSAPPLAWRDPLGGFMGMPATGKSVDVQLIDIIRFGDDGLAHEHWGVFDALGMMQQLGAIPEPSSA